jgi:hypothetical protein
LVADEPDAVTQADQAAEVAKLHGAMESFREKFTAMPPSVGGERKLVRFVRKAFPSARAGSLPGKVPEAAESLPFWLSKVSTDPRQPFADDKEDVLRYKFYGFDEKRIKDGRYYPTSDFKTDPYVYFDSGGYAVGKYKEFEPYYLSDAKKPGVRNYLAAETCQIIGPGKDGKLGCGGSLLELSEEDRDNVVSFAKKVVGEVDWKKIEVGE